MELPRALEIVKDQIIINLVAASNVKTNTK